MIYTSSTIFYSFKEKSNYYFFVKRIYYIDYLKFIKRLKINHKKGK